MKLEFISMRRTLTAAAFAVTALALVLTASPAQAQAIGDTDVDINIPDIVILHYFSNVDITIGSNEFGTFLTGAPGDATIDEGTIAPAAGGFTQDLSMSPTALTGNSSAAVLTLQNAWAVRAVSLGAPASQTQLAITVPDATLTHTSGATMSISAAAVDDGGGSAATITFNAPGLFAPQLGSVELTLDMTNSTDAGDYLDGVFRLTATNI